MAYILDRENQVEAGENLEIMLGDEVVTGTVFDAGGGSWTIGDWGLIFLAKVNAPMCQAVPLNPGNILEDVEVAKGGFISVLAHHPNDISVDTPAEIRFRKAGKDDTWPMLLTRCISLKEDLDFALIHYGMAEVPNDLYLLFLYTDWMDGGCGWRVNE